jgi:hypothetical protein
MSKEEFVLVNKAVFRVMYELRLKKDLSVECDCKGRISTFKRHLFLNHPAFDISLMIDGRCC